MYSFLWFLFAFTNLIILVYQDYKNKMRVDSRLNFFMLGISSFLLAMSDLWLLGFWKGFGLSLLVFIIPGLIYRFLLKYGQGDIDALNWINIGLFSMNIRFALVFNLVLMICHVIHSSAIILTCKLKNKKVEKTPFFIVILIALFVFFLISIFYL